MNKKLLFLIILCIIASGVASPAKGPHEDTEVEAQLTGIIIKVKPDVIIMPEGAHKAPLESVEIKSEEISELNKRFNLISIERIGTKKKTEDAPDNAGEPDVGNTFLLKFPGLVDPAVIIEEYVRIEDVIYAEEDKAVGIF